jgi:hypothetical protein
MRDPNCRQLSCGQQKGQPDSNGPAPTLCFLCLFVALLTLAIPTISTKITSTRVFQLPVALGTDADHV